MSRVYGDNILLCNGTLKSTRRSALHERQLRPTALIVDRSDEIELLARTLEQFCWRVFLVESVQNAVAILATYQVDLAIVNDAISGDDAGFMLCAELNRIMQDCRPRVLMMTSELRTRESLTFVGVDYQLQYDKTAEMHCKANQLASVIMAANRIVNNGWGDDPALA